MQHLPCTQHHTAENLGLRPHQNISTYKKYFTHKIVVNTILLTSQKLFVIKSIKIFTLIIIFPLSGCDADFPKSCYLAAMFHKLKFPKPIKTKQDTKIGTGLFEKACNLGNPTACHYYGTDLIKAGGEDKNKAAPAFEKACDLGK